MRGGLTFPPKPIRMQQRGGARPSLAGAGSARAFRGLAAVRWNLAGAMESGLVPRLARRLGIAEPDVLR